MDSIFNIIDGIPTYMQFVICLGLVIAGFVVWMQLGKRWIGLAILAVGALWAFSMVRHLLS